MEPRWTTNNPIPKHFLNRNELWSRAAALVGMKRSRWIQSTLDARAIDIVCCAQRHPMLLKPGTPIWALEKLGTWRIRSMAMGREEVIVTSPADGIPPYIDPTLQGWVVTWVGHGTGYVVGYDALEWPPGRKVEGLSSTTWLQWLLMDTPNPDGARPCATSPASPPSPSSSSEAAAPAPPPETPPVESPPSATPSPGSAESPT